MGPTNKVTVNFVSKRPDGGMSLTSSKKDRGITKILTKTFDEFRNGSTTASMRLWPELVAEQFPESIGQVEVIRLGCYDLPNDRVKQFFNGFVRFIEGSEEYQNDIKSSPHITSLEFKIDLESLSKRTEQHVDLNT